MTEIKHTPGPWIVMPNASVDTLLTVQTVDSPVWRIASVQATNKPIGESNASLIAAAPDMLAALQLAIRSRWLSIDVDSNRTREACDIRSAICAAIDKATGEQ